MDRSSTPDHTAFPSLLHQIRREWKSDHKVLLSGKGRTKTRLTHCYIIYEHPLVKKVSTGQQIIVRNHLGIMSLIAYEGFVCDICQCKFTSASFLLEHKKSHRGKGSERRYTCPLCCYATDWISHMKLHMLTHSGDRPHKCSYCNKGFTRKTHLDRHILIHTGERPFTCDFCGKAFRTQGSLTEHRRIHLQERPYMCRHCNLTFVHKSTLIQHEKRHM